MKKLEHYRPYYKGIGNVDYSECLDEIKRTWKYIIFASVLSVLFLFFTSIIDALGHTESVLYALGWFYMGFYVFALLTYISILKKYKLRMKEITGE